MERRTASSIGVLAPPPRLMLATAGLRWFAVTQSTPATTWATVPEPEQLSTRTAYNCTPLATPYCEPPTPPLAPADCEPPTVPATCVPWPLQSLAVPPEVIAS